VQLKAGSQKTPILIAPGLDGRASFSGLAKRIRTEHPIYGFQAKDVDGLEEPQDRIEDMAQYCLDALHELQTEGPYMLIGYSFGGLVALEIAQRLSEQQKNVGLLVLVDAYPHPRYLSAGQRLRLIAQRTKNHLLAMKQRTIGGSISYLWSELERRLRLAGVHRRGTHLLEPSSLSLAQTTLRVKRKAYEALENYQPRVYRGKTKFVKSETATYFPGDPCSVWAHLAAAFEVETVRGSHLDMVTTHFEGLSDVLTR
jgi:acetoacetyl-CoA synthetase